jgi:hypothetical protein
MANYRQTSLWIGILFFHLLLQSSCKNLTPLFIKNDKKETRKEKRAEKKIERKENKIEKELEKIDELKNKIAKSDSTSTMPIDTIVMIVIDTAKANKWLQQQINFNTYQCKAKIHFESETEKHNFNINFRLKKDSIIWASIHAPIIGEVARAIITPDSVKAIERINKKSFLYSYSNIQKLININVDFKTLQDIIIGNPIATHGELIDIKEVNTFVNIYIKGLDFTNQLSYTKTDSILKLIQLQTSRPASSSSLLIALNEYQKIPQGSFATERKYNILDLKGAIELEMSINKVEFDIPLEYPFTIPKNYKKTND